MTTMISILLFLSVLVFVSGKSATDTYELTLLHTNDLHSRFDQGIIYNWRHAHISIRFILADDLKNNKLSYFVIELFLSGCL